MESIINFNKHLFVQALKAFFNEPNVPVNTIDNKPIPLTAIFGDFYFSEEEIFATNSCFLMTTNDENISLKYLLAIMNSKIILFYYKMIGSCSGMGTLEWTGVRTQKIPIPRLASSATSPFIFLVDQILEAKKQNQDTTSVEHEIDVRVLLTT